MAGNMAEKKDGLPGAEAEGGPLASDPDQGVTSGLVKCPQCQTMVKEYRNPFPTADIIIEQGKGIVLILRRNEPHITTVYIACSVGGVLQAQDDAQEIGVFSEADLPAELAFDHDRILKDYFLYKKTGQRRAL
jgi:hypothetical protein